MTDLNTLFRELVLLEIELWDAVDARLRHELETPLDHVMPLRAVASHPECRVEDVRRELGITTGGASKAVDRIVAAGLAMREPHPTDRRASVVRTTASGRRLLKRAERLVEQELATRFAPLSDRQRDQLAAAITALREGETRA